ncbi:transcriptional regulator FtsR [Ornithinimicrobium cryptoxanthini]|uniref:MerR family transcriptional regulator n=1 Tax=Ornithinimicrobium cryptoxanthini TaxID=2934161 RepID=A0ABY4YM83_9MICO|nr:MerR family transcriptional regulator [Ornithinimicrobium cryptoxanthini]USQ77908.1 MerR family transcriptional regulator [Ornithinimicrobium cryptoxanthini]
MSLLTIGQVLRELQQEFPDLTVSKIRFLETEGLVLPQRRESGQRAFAPDDVVRLRFVLRAQRDKFWPLKVIKAALDRMDLGVDLQTPERSTNEYAEAPGTEDQAGTGDGPAGSAATDTSASAAPRLPTAAQLRRRRAIRLTPLELREHTGLDLAAYTQLKAFGLIRLDSSGRHPADDLDVARECTALAAYGLEPRHLRLFRVAADREVSLAQQILEPVRRRRARGVPEADPEALETEIIAHTLALHVALVRAGLGQTQ